MKVHEWTHRNHFRWGYDGNAFRLREAPGEEWFVEYGACILPPLPFRQEVARTARLIRESTTLPIWLLLSGGMDSEVALRGFVDAGIPVRVAITRFANDLNIHDISCAVVTCEQLRIPYRFLELDLLNYWESDALRYADRVQCTAAAITPLLWAMDQLDGYVVVGSGECYLVKPDLEDDGHALRPRPIRGWRMAEKERVASLYRHLLLTEHEGAPGFFQYTPEIMLTWLRDPLVRQTCTGEEPKHTNTLKIKNKVYYQYYPEAMKRFKQTGLERVWEAEKTLQAALDLRYPHANQVFWTEYNALVARLAG